MPLTPGIIAGHEGAGVVAAIGEGVDPKVWKLNDRAGLKPIFDVCHECEYCRLGMETNCNAGTYSYSTYPAFFVFSPS